MFNADELLDGKPGATPGAGAPAAPPMPADALLDGGDKGQGATTDSIRAATPYEEAADHFDRLTYHLFSSGPKARPQPEGIKMGWGDVPNAVAGKVTEMALNPGNLLLGAFTGGAGPLIKGIVGKAYGAYAVAQTAKQVPQLYREVADPNVSGAQKTVDVTSATAQAGLGYLGLRTKMFPKVAAAAHAMGQVQTLVPEAAKAAEAVTPAEAPRVLSEASLEAEKPQEKAVLMQAAEAIHEVAPTEPVPEAPAPEVKPVPPEDVKTETAPEPKKDEGKLIGIKNVAREEAATELGDEAPKHGEETTDEAEQAKAQAKLEADPLAGRKLIERLAQILATGKPTNVSTGDVFLASHEMVTATNERAAAESAYQDALASGDKEGAQDAEQRIARARDYYTKVSNVVTQFGTEQAQAFRARAVMFRDDYSIASMERQLAAATKDGKLTPEHESFVRRIQKSFVKTQEQLAAHEAKRLAAAKRRAEIAAEEIGAKLQRGDLSPNPKPEPVQQDAELERLQAAHARVKQEFQEAVIRERLENRTPFEKLQDLAVKWRRGFVLSGPVTLAKLTAASAFRMVSTPLEDAVGALYGKLPVVREIAKGSPVESGFNTRALAKAYSEAWSKGLRDAAQTLKTGQSDLDVLFGKGKDDAVGEGSVVDRSIIDYVGNIHGALKAPLKRFSYTLAMEKQFDHAIRTEADAGNPAVQTAMSNRAYRKAQANLFLQDNVFNDAISAALGTVEHSKTAPGIGKAVGTAARIAMPIRKVPTNMVGEGIEYSTGLATGSWKIAKAARAGFETLTADQKDVIMRNLKKGTLGAGGLAMLLGYFTAKDSPIKFGGFYQAGEKRKKGDVAAGSMSIYGVELPSFLLDHPIFQTFQVGATTYRVANSKIRKGDRDAQGWLSGAGAAAMGLVDETPFGRTDVELGKVIGGDPSERQYQWGEFVKGLVVPQGVQTAAQMTDKDRKGEPVKRKADTVMEHVESGIPGLRQTLPKRKIDHSER